MRHREPAICIRATDYSETSQVVCFLTRGAGLVRLLAKGSKRAKSATGGAIDLLSEGDLVFIAAALSALAVYGALPPWWWVAFVPVIARTVWGLTLPPDNVRQVGLREAWVALSFTAIAAAIL